MVMIIKNIFAIGVLSVLVSACAYTPKIGQTQMVAEPNSVDLMLADAADRATRALETLAAMEQTQMPIKPIASVPNAPQELQRAVTFDWTGPVEPLIEELARKAGYNYGVIGDQPSAPITVSLKAMNKPLINVLRDFGMQMGARGDLNVNAQSRVIEIQYASFTNGAT
jgi:defect-in-organelle-trafficking protein DotD